ncbi:hypothetical protein Tsubulata_030370 [Turnera subulata]|uniref:Uncharacterized protein n=1 Tax=Turnera subulata TaxID=218843 RepID=A0A9Q0GLX4_9ROSI|nr:hypothetical protein Tsubulata_030370 [Turnera subulata]
MQNDVVEVDCPQGSGEAVGQRKPLCHARISKLLFMAMRELRLIRRVYYKLDQVLPNMASIADIRAISYDVCGVVRMVSTGQKAKVKHGSPKSTGSEDKWCWEQSFTDVNDS